MIPAAIRVEAVGESPRPPTQTPNSPAPAKPPTLQRPCMPDMRRLPEAFSTITAWIFTTTSMQPITAPKSSSTGTAARISLTWLRRNSKTAKARLAKVSTFRQPSRTAAAPDRGMVRREPMPMHSNKSPRISSPMASLSRKSGTKGAQEAAPKPPIKNTALVACWVQISAALNSSRRVCVISIKILVQSNNQKSWATGSPCSKV